MNQTTPTFKYQFALQAAAAGDLEELKRMHEHGFPLFEPESPNHLFNYNYCTTFAAQNGHLDCLRYAHEVGCEWNIHTTEQAAEYGHLHCLQYAHENGCEWNGWTIAQAAKNGHLDCLRYAHENGCEWHINTARDAAEFGHLDCLRYAIENGCPNDHSVRLPAYAAAGGKLNVLIYLKEIGIFQQVLSSNQTIWKYKVAELAAQNGHLDCLQFVRENGFPWDNATSYYAAGDIDCLRYVHENGCPWDYGVPYIAARQPSLDCLRYAYEHGCPFNDYICDEVANKLTIIKNIIKKEEQDKAQLLLQNNILHDVLTFVVFDFF
jgi:hypothetical protein